MLQTVMEIGLEEYGKIADALGADPKVAELLGVDLCDACGEFFILGSECRRCMHDGLPEISCEPDGIA